MDDEQRTGEVSRRRFLGSTALAAGAAFSAWNLPFGTGAGRALAQPRMAAAAVTPRLFVPGEFLVSTSQRYTPSSNRLLLDKELTSLTNGLVEALGKLNSFARRPPQLSPLRIYNIDKQPSIVHYRI